MNHDDFMIGPDDTVLVTGAGGFIGTRVVGTLLDYGFTDVRCFVRPAGDLSRLNAIVRGHNPHNVSICTGNLLSRDDCTAAVKGACVIFHLAAGREKTFPGAFMNSAVTTRNLLDASLGAGLKRFVNISSFAVYTNRSIPRGGLLDEACEVEVHPEERHEPYCFGKVKQDELVLYYGSRHNMPYVIIRPGIVYGPGRNSFNPRIGIDTFGFFMHLGGSNRIPLTYVDNCAEAIVLAGIKKGVDGEVFNVVDDQLPTSRQFLRMYKKNVRTFRSVYIPYRILYCLCGLWEKYAEWSEGQLPPLFNRRRCAAYWKGNTYSNRKLKERLGWKPKVPFREAARRFFEYARQN